MRIGENMNQNLDIFKAGLKELNIELTNLQIEQFLNYYEMLVEKNKVMNLTAITEFGDVLLKHFLDSLSLVKLLDITKVESVIDVGTGAGFPGIPLKIAFPHLKVTLLDSLNKRVKFLSEVCDKLGLTNVEAVHARAEDGGRNPKYREQFDLCVSRAVANLSTLSEYCVPFIKVGGYFVPYKAGDVDKELKNAKGAIKKLGSKIVDKKEFMLPESDISRVLIHILKERPIKNIYPRKNGMPSKEPLS